MRTTFIAAILALFFSAGCGDISGFGGPVLPLATVRVQVNGDIDALRPPGSETPQLRVALVWGAQWQPEPFCFLPPESPEAAAVINGGCPDNFGFVPARVAASTTIEIGVPATIDLLELPAADVMVGDVTARVAYASLVVFDDRDRDETITLLQDHGEENTFAPPTDPDVVYGASFLSMTRPDQRIAFREGEFVQTAFYPRVGCEPPPRGFSVLGAGGFSAQDAIAAVLLGELPAQDPSTCLTTTVDETVVTIDVQPPDVVGEVVCQGIGGRGAPDYHEAEVDFPELTERTIACVGAPMLGEYRGQAVQLVTTGLPNDVCKSVTHFVLVGCSDDLLCDPPQFDFTASPPPTWPCSTDGPVFP